MLKTKMKINEVQIPDLEKIVKFETIVCFKDDESGNTVALPKPPLFKIISDDNGKKVYDDKWHHGNVKYTGKKKKGVKEGARKKDMQKPVSLR